jgi:hypothetical protein
MEKVADMPCTEGAEQMASSILLKKWAGRIPITNPCNRMGYSVTFFLDLSANDQDHRARDPMRVNVEKPKDECAPVQRLVMPPLRVNEDGLAMVFKISSSVIIGLFHKLPPGKSEQSLFVGIQSR